MLPVSLVCMNRLTPLFILNIIVRRIFVGSTRRVGLNMAFVVNCLLKTTATS